jgi:hypothetical protein
VKLPVSLWLAAFCWTKSLLCNVAYWCCLYSESTHFSYVLQEYSVRISRQRSWMPCIRSKVLVNRPDAHQSSNIRSDDVVIPFGLPSVSRSFELFKVASIPTFQQHVRTPFSVRQVKKISSQTQIWEDNCNRADGRSTSFGRYPW